MWRELARIGGYAKAFADTVDIGLQHVEVGGRNDACPYSMRLFLAESANTTEGQREGRPFDAVERIGDFVGDMTFDITDEAQRQMVVFDIDPSGAGQAAPEQGERKRRITRNFEGREKTWHGKPPVLESNSRITANH